MNSKYKPVMKPESAQPKKRTTSTRLASHPPLIKTNLPRVEYFKDIVATIREPLLVLDKNLRVLSANRSFYKLFKVKQKELCHRMGEAARYPSQINGSADSEETIS